MSALIEILAAHYPTYDARQVFDGCACGESMFRKDHPAHVAAVIAGTHTIIPKGSSLSIKIWRLLGDLCDEVEPPNYEENDYNAGVIEGLSRAQVAIRKALPGLLPGPVAASAREVRS